jgi:glycosyltransferase involved in cell wall biosynthesis
MLQIASKVLYIDQSGLLAGGELNLYDFLRSSQGSASVVLLEDGPFRVLLEKTGLPVTVLPLGSIDSIRRKAGLASVFRVLPAGMDLRKRLLRITKKADIVYANSQKAFLLSAISRRGSQPLIWHLHDILVPEHFSKLIRKIAVFAGNRFATRIIVNSKATGAAFVAQGGRADKVRLIYCGLDPAPFDSISPQTVASTRASICHAENFLVGVFGRLAEWKGQHVLLEAVSTLPEVHIAVVGEAFFGEDPYKERLLVRARQPDLAGRVHFLGFRKDIPELMRCVDLVAHTSTAPEPFGRVIVEGMLARKPVVASNAGGAAEIIENDCSGLLTDPGSVAKLSEAIARISQDSTMAQGLAKEGRRRAEELFSLAGMVKGVHNVIEEVAHSLPAERCTL